MTMQTMLRASDIASTCPQVRSPMRSIKLKLFMASFPRRHSAGADYFRKKRKRKNPARGRMVEWREAEAVNGSTLEVAVC